MIRFAHKIRSILGHFFYPIRVENLKNWNFVDDENGPFGKFLSCSEWQSVDDGVTGHRFIMYPKDSNWHGCSRWTLVDFSTDKVYDIFSIRQLNRIVPKAYCKNLL